MNTEALRACCLSFPAVTEVVQWGEHLVLKVAGKVFAIIDLSEEQRFQMSVKADPEQFYDLLERAGVAPAPHLGHARWVALERETELSSAEVRELIATSYRLVVAGLPRKTQAALAAGELPDAIPTTGKPEKKPAAKKPAVKKPR
jgi:predicted DNA-binding protein (MmcQ/YjbR family)